MAPSSEAAGRLRGIPGVGERAAEVILAEVGPDWRRSRRPAT